MDLWTKIPFFKMIAKNVLYHEMLIFSANIRAKMTFKSDLNIRYFFPEILIFTDFWTKIVCFQNDFKITYFFVEILIFTDLWTEVRFFKMISENVDIFGYMSKK